MTEFDQLLAEIRKEYLHLDGETKKEFEDVLRNLHKYLLLQPNAKRIRLVRTSLQRRIQKETGKLLSIDKMDISAMQELRNEIVHDRKVDDSLLLELGNWIWNRVGDVYSDDASALFNTLSYAIKPENLPISEISSSAEKIAVHFYEIYRFKNDFEKATIVKNLIPLILPKFKRKLLTSSNRKAEK